MRRYLINLSYIGTNFSGIQRSLLAVDNQTIQGAIEKGLETVRALNSPLEIFLSSRTDAGVHALHNTVHVDIEKRAGHEVKPEYITFVLNKYFYKENLKIRVINTEHVPETFNSRLDAIQRTYLYRLCVSKERFVDESGKGSKRAETFKKFAPIEEQFRCLFLVERDFDIEKAREASKLLIGRHDFRSFMNVSSESKTKHPFFALRTIHDIKIEPGRPITTAINFDRSLNTYDYWDFTISGRSFIYRQVRRIVSVLLEVGTGKLNTRDVYEMLTIPSKHSWKSSELVPPYGLYLVNVLYDEDAKKFVD